MSKTLGRSGRSSFVTGLLVASGWSQDPYGRAGVVPEWNDRYPDLPVVADGRPCKAHRDQGVTTPDDHRAMGCDECFTDRGRGTTLIDLVRRTGDSISRADFLSVKCATIGTDGKLPSRIDLGTGNVETIQAITSAAMRGSAIPVVLFASGDNEDGTPSDEGFACFVDVAPFIREHGTVPVSEESYGRGQAPPCYVALSSRRITGIPGGTSVAMESVRAHECDGAPLPPGKWYGRALNFVPHFDEKGRFWSKPYAVHYSELRISLSAVGIKRKDWVPMKGCDLAAFVENQNWDSMS